jgi:hypothetical protein
MAFDLARIPDSLKRAYLDKRCALLVGAGASHGAGLPLWGGLLEETIAAAEREAVIPATRAAEYRAVLRKPDKFLMVASALKEDMGSYFDDLIERIFISSEPKPTDLHRAFTALDKLSFIVTTNYDTLIEQAFQAAHKRIPVLSFVDGGDIQRRLARREFFLLKAHGDAARLGNGIVLTTDDYRDILYKNRGYQSLLSAMFTMNTMVFVGASLADPEINLMLSYIADVFSPTSGPTHYALIAQEEITEIEKERWRKDFKVQLIPISKAKDYEELTEFVKALSSVT